MDKVRVGSGMYRGRVLATPGAGTHPMGAREKLALFNMIGNALPGAAVLDAFAGSGALGIEALSRGAKNVVFVEKNRRACKVITANLRELGIDAKSWRVLRGDVGIVAEDLLRLGFDDSGQAPLRGDVRLSVGAEQPFDIVIADPPYNHYDAGAIEALARLVARPNGVLVLSHPEEAPEIPGLMLQKTRQYAQAHLSVYECGA